MTNEEIKEALMNGRPVIVKSLLNGDILCKKVSAIRYYRNDKGKIAVLAECLDLCGHSIMYAPPEDVIYAESEENQNG